MIKNFGDRACVLNNDGSKTIKCFEYSKFGKTDAQRRAKEMLGAIEASKAKVKGQEFKSLFIEASVQEMAREDIHKFVDSAILKRIKETDKNPQIRAYVIGHEGTSKGKLLGIGDRVKRWYDAAIQKLVDKLKIGTKLFHLHNDDSSHEGRSIIGEIVGKSIEYVDGKLKAIALAWIKPEYVGQKFDVPSVEGDLIIDRQGEEIVVNDVTEITGIALGNSDINKPGFSEAGLLASVQMFESTEGKKENLKMSMTTDEVKKAIKEEGFTIGDLFEGNDLQNDPVIKGITNELKGRYAGRTDEKLEKKLASLQSENDTLKADNEKLQLVSKKVEIKDKLSGVFESRKITDEKQKKFIEKNFESFVPDLKNPDGSLNTFIDKTVADFKAYSELFGVKSEPEKTPETKEPELIPNYTREGESYKFTLPDSLDPRKNDAIVQ